MRGFRATQNLKAPAQDMGGVIKCWLSGIICQHNQTAGNLIAQAYHSHTPSVLVGHLDDVRGACIEEEVARAFCDVEFYLEGDVGMEVIRLGGTEYRVPCLKGWWGKGHTWTPGWL